MARALWMLNNSGYTHAHAHVTFTAFYDINSQANAPQHHFTRTLPVLLKATAGGT